MITAVERVCSFLICSLGCWMLAFFCIGMTTQGKYFAEYISSRLDIEHSSFYAISLAIPILLSGSIATIYIVISGHSKSLNLNDDSSKENQISRWPQHQKLHKWRFFEMNSNNFSLCFVVCPLIIMLVGNIYSHLNDEETLSFGVIMRIISNSCGFVAIIATSFFLVPVARQSPILKFFHVDPIAAIRIHDWCGKIIIIGGVAHGCLHMFRWNNLADLDVIAMLFPPLSCLSATTQNGTGDDIHLDEGTEFTCYLRIRNLTGFLGMIFLIIIAFSSMNYIRRMYYRWFYITHVTAAPLYIIFIILHWRKSILYIAPSIIYYMAASIPSIIERYQNQELEGGVKLTNIESIGESEQQQCISLTFRATALTMKAYHPGQFCKLTAPKISNISHPFTINCIPNCNNELRILFRVRGRFTKKLAQSLLQTYDEDKERPDICVDGFHGIQTRVEQALRHDVVTIIAGGIGITPYLSLLLKLHNRLCSTESATTKKIVLHWVCREKSLIDYVNKEYFVPLLSQSISGTFQINVVVHCRESLKTVPSEKFRNELVIDDEEAQTCIKGESSGVDFSLSPFFVDGSATLLHKIIAGTTFLTITWLGMLSVILVYNKNPSKVEFLPRLQNLLCLISLCSGVSFFFNWCLRSLFFKKVKDEKDIDPIKSDCCSIQKLEVATKETNGYGTMNDPFEKNALNKDSTSFAQTVLFSQKTGPRPPVHVLLKDLESSDMPGLFLCGPEAMIDELGDAAKRMGFIRNSRKNDGRPRISIYEEKFVM